MKRQVRCPNDLRGKATDVKCARPHPVGKGKMNYPLLITVCSLAVGMIGMERWCSWRLSVAQKRERSLKGIPAAQGADVVPAEENSEGLVAADFQPGVSVGLPSR